MQDIHLVNGWCDACGTARVEARYIINLSSGRFITMCWSHFMTHRFELEKQGAIWQEAEEINV